jgi:hypothetical protein
VLLTLPRPAGLHGPARTADLRLLDQWLAREVVRTAIGVNTWQGVEYVDRDAFRSIAEWAVRLDAIDAAVGEAAIPAPGDVAGTAGDLGPAARQLAGSASVSRPGPDLVTRLTRAAEEAGYRVDRLRAGLTPATPPRRTAPPRSEPPNPKGKRA